MALSDSISKEIQASQYYIHKNFVNSYYSVYKFVEQWVADNIFRQDTSRVFLASNDYAFRRRFELTDTSKDFSTLEFSSLRFPFANYWPQNSAWILDPRIAAKSAVLTYIGIYEGNTKLRAAQSLFNIPVTFWFDREDDARLAYEILYFKSYNEHYFEMNVSYGRNNTIEDNKGSVSTLLALPMNLLIEDLKFNPEFKETNWLKENRLFAITTDFRVRSYAITPPKQPRYDLSLTDSGELSDGSRYEDGINYFYIVDDVITNFNKKGRKVITCDAGFNPINQSYSGSTHFPEKGEEGTLYVDSFKDNINPSQINFYLWDYCNDKYISPEVELDSMSIRASGEYIESTLDITKFDCITNITQTSNTLEWAYGESTTSEDIEFIEIHMTGYSDFIKVDSNAMSYKLTKLKAGSKYYGYIIFIGKNGISKRFVISFTTKESKKPNGKLNSLVGTTW